MILLNEILPLRIGKNPDDFYSMFEVVIQLGAILAVVVLFWSQIWPFGRKNNKAPLAKTGIGAWVKTDIFVLWFHILVSTIPAAIIGVLFDDVFERLFYNFQTVAIMLILFGIAFIVIETRHNGKSAKINSLVDISYTTALMIGFFQLIAAVFPGTSRSGATIVGALLIGVSRTVAAEYTFFLAIPVMFGASLLKLVKFGFHFTGCYSDYRDDCGICRFTYCYQIPDGLHKEAQLYCVWMVPYSSWCDCAALWYRRASLNTF